MSQYPRQEEIGMDNGGEFEKKFSNLCVNMGQKKKVSNDYNPQSNKILECIHQVLEDGLQVFNLENKEIDPVYNDPFDEYLVAVVCTIWSVYHQTYGHSPAQLVYGCDMFLTVGAKINWEKIKNQKQEAIQKSNEWENSCRIPHNYKKDDWVTMIKPGQIVCTPSVPHESPFKVVRKHRNRSITIETAPYTNKM